MSAQCRELSRNLGCLTTGWAGLRARELLVQAGGRSLPVRDTGKRTLSFVKQCLLKSICYHHNDFFHSLKPIV